MLSIPDIAIQKLLYESDNSLVQLQATGNIEQFALGTWDGILPNTVQLWIATFGSYP
jgi:hypothetical protein